MYSRKECFIRHSNTWKLLKKTLISPRFFNKLLRVRISDETLLDDDLLHTEFFLLGEVRGSQSPMCKPVENFSVHQWILRNIYNEIFSVISKLWVKRRPFRINEEKVLRYGALPKKTRVEDSDLPQKKVSELYFILKDVIYDILGQVMITFFEH